MQGEWPLPYPLPSAEAKGILDYCTERFREDNFADNSELFHYIYIFLASTVSWYGLSKTVSGLAGAELSQAIVPYWKKFAKENFSTILEKIPPKFQKLIYPSLSDRLGPACLMLIIGENLHIKEPTPTNKDDFLDWLTTYLSYNKNNTNRKKAIFTERAIISKILDDLLRKNPNNLYWRALKLKIFNQYTPTTEKMVEERLVDLTIWKNEIENIPAQTAELQAKLASLQNNLTGLSLQSEEDDIRNIQEIQEFTNKEIRALTRFAKAANTHQLSATISKITSITNRSDLPPDSKQRILDFGTIVLGNVKSNYIEDDALRDRTSSQLNILKTLASLLTRNSSFRDDVVLQTIVSSIPPINQENLRDLEELCELQEQIFNQEPLITEDQPYPEDLANLKRQLQLKIWDLQIKKFEKFIQNTEESIYLHNAEREAILGKIIIIKEAIADDSTNLDQKISTVEEHSQQLMAILPDSANISWFRQALRNFLNWVSRNSETVAQNEQHISAIKENYRNTSLSTSQGAATSSENIPKPNPDDDAPDDPQNDSSSLRM